MQLQLFVIAVFAVRHISTNDIANRSVKEQKTEPVYVPGQKDAFLSCNIKLSNGKSLGQYTVTWLKGDDPVSNLNDSGRFTVSRNQTLIISNPTHDDAGLYVARFENKDQFPDYYNCNVRYLAKPMVLHFGTSVNRVVGQTLELVCEVRGYPVSISWYKESEDISSIPDNTRLMLMPHDGYENASLQIRNLMVADSGIYSCVANSYIFNISSAKSVKVRVTATLAAVWPFLAIAAEVIVLCGIIGLYERHENKKIARHSYHTEMGLITESSFAGLCTGFLNFLYRFFISEVWHFISCVVDFFPYSIIKLFMHNIICAFFFEPKHPTDKEKVTTSTKRKITAPVKEETITSAKEEKITSAKEEITKSAKKP